MSARSDINEEFICFEQLINDPNPMLIVKTRMTFVDRQPLGVLQLRLQTFGGVAHDSVFALFDLLHINTD